MSIRAPVNSSNTSEEEDGLREVISSSGTLEGSVVHQDIIQLPGASHGGRRRSSFAGPRRIPIEMRNYRVSVQDLGDCNGTIVFMLPSTLDDLLMMISSRFGYKGKYCKLFSKYGAIIEDILVLKDDDLLYASDGGEFPQQMREAAFPGLGLIGNVAKSPSSAAYNAQLHSLERYDIWGWPRIGQILGASHVRQRLNLSWRTSGILGTIMFLVNYMSFMFPPTCYGRGACNAQQYVGDVDPQLVKSYFWFFALGSLSSLLCVLIAATLTLQLNLLPTNKDVFWFLKEYGNWLVGYPTTLLVVTVMLTFGGFLSAAQALYNLPIDAWVLIGIFVFVGIVTVFMSLYMSSRSWARVNGMNLTRVWPDDPYHSDAPAMSGPMSVPTALTGTHTPRSATHVSNLVSNATSSASQPASQLASQYVSHTLSQPNVFSSYSPTEMDDSSAVGKLGRVKS